MPEYPKRHLSAFVFTILQVIFTQAQDERLSCGSPYSGSLLSNLTHPSRFDKIQPPPTENGEPLTVYLKLYFYFLKSYEVHSLQFTVYMLLQSRYQDNRLQWDPEEKQLEEIVGTKEASKTIWTPHVYLFNERESTVMGDGNDVMININHTGAVYYTKRLKTTLFCWMKLHKFPFDSQECTLRLDNWSSNKGSVVLEWEETDPVHCRDDLSLTEFSLVGEPIPGKKSYKQYMLSDDEDLNSTLTSLTVKFNLRRESGFYIYDYFIPSVMLVVVSWVSFWLEADAVPARVTLGTSTILTFLILALQTGNSLPKVSYIKASEIWFIVVTAFIFGSLVEFAFVNTIYRSRRKEIALKKLNSKYIIKETLTPKAKRKQIPLERSSSCPDAMHQVQTTSFGPTLRAEHAESPFKRSLPNIEILDTDVIGEPKSTSSRWRLLWWKKNSSMEGLQEPTRMTPQQISHWIDARSRIVFPCSFIIFNMVYWTYVYTF